MLLHFLCVCCSILSILAVPTAEDLQALRIAVINKIDAFGNDDDGPENKPLIGAIIRLVFHDCVGPYNPGSAIPDTDNTKRLCNGCIDLDNHEHIGLKEFAVDPIEPICAEYADVMNRADCWVAIGNIAIEYSHHLAKENDPLPKIPYWFGRDQCELSPDFVEGVDAGTEFPLSHSGWDKYMRFFNQKWSFGPKQVTALLGAHTVGRCHASATGYDGKWTSDSYSFNNAYYKMLVKEEYQWDQTEPMDTVDGEIPQWYNRGRPDDEEELLMLTSDIGVLADFEGNEKGSDGNNYVDEPSGVCTCRLEGFTLEEYPTCGREESFDFAHEYAADNALWLSDFVKVWDIFVTHNQGTLARVDMPAFEDTRTPAVGPTDPPQKGPTKRPSRPIKPNGKYCCQAKIREGWNGNYNGVCWGETSEYACLSHGTSKCEWDTSNCKKKLTCLLRDAQCKTNADCCSERCKVDDHMCR